MEPTTFSEPPGFDKLSKPEQILYVQALWDRIAELPHEAPGLESHLQLAEERLRRCQGAPGATTSAWDTINRLRPG